MTKKIKHFEKEHFIFKNYYGINLFLFFYIQLQIEIYTKIYKTNEHPLVAQTLSQIAQLLSKMEENSRALGYFEKVLGKFPVRKEFPQSYINLI